MSVLSRSIRNLDKFTQTDGEKGLKLDSPFQRRVGIGCWIRRGREKWLTANCCVVYSGQTMEKGRD